jgi:hypothetical protein
MIVSNKNTQILIKLLGVFIGLVICKVIDRYTPDEWHLIFYVVLFVPTFIFVRRSIIQSNKRYAATNGKKAN